MPVSRPDRFSSLAIFVVQHIRHHQTPVVYFDGIFVMLFLRATQRNDRYNK